MLNFLLTIASSYKINSTGYFVLNLTYEGSELEFSLPQISGYDYYWVFSQQDSSLSLDFESLNRDVYKINSLSAKYIVKGDSNKQISFGIFLIPKIYDVLEIWIKTNYYTYSITETSSPDRDYYLIIIDDNEFSIEITKNADSNTIYVSSSGSVPNDRAGNDLYTGMNIFTIHYNHFGGTTASTSYRVTPKYSRAVSSYKYYDESHSSLNFNDGITIYQFPSPKGDSSSLSYGYNSKTILPSTTYFAPRGTLFIFTKAESISGVATISSTTLDILGSTKIRAIAFYHYGFLNLTATGSSQTCNFYLYRFSVGTGIPYKIIILSGSFNYKMEPKDRKYYCIISAISNGNVDIKSDDVYHASSDAYGRSEYSTTTSNKQSTKPIQTFLATDNSGKISFELSSSSNDDEIVIDGERSKYDFYEIFTDYSAQANLGDAVGKVSHLRSSGLPSWAIAIIVIIVIIIIITIISIICCCCCRCCRCSSSSNRVKASEEHSSSSSQSSKSTTSRNSPQQQPQPQQPNYNPPPSYSVPQQQQPVYGVPPQQQPVYGAYPQQPVYGAYPQQPVYGAPPQITGAYITPAPSQSYNAPETKNGYDNPYN